MAAPILMTASYLKAFLQQQDLPHSYLNEAEQHLRPLINNTLTQHNHGTKPLVIGINGCQGSGKSTLAAYLEAIFSHKHSLNCAVMSLDDFYLSKTDREQLAQNVHPLFKTRGVPGSHDLNVALQTLTQLKQQTGQVSIRRFDKLRDDICDKKNFSNVTLPVDVIILEGWCLGLTAQTSSDLERPINDLEKNQDKEGVWRQYVNQRLSDYQPLFQQVDLLVMLKASSFECVHQWRLEQEEKLDKKLNDEKAPNIMNAEAIHQFIQFFERLTRHALNTLPSRADYLFELDAQRKIIASRT